ncbi:MAG: hypothetical protein JW712_09900 [Dehalococcoidales bacterium]|nr:hypothetical protein [Dehalococcoidales bacterium]
MKKIHVNRLAHSIITAFIVLSLFTGVIVLTPPETVLSDPAGVTVPRYYANWEEEWRTSSATFVDVEPSTGYFPLTLTFTPPDTANYLVVVCFSLSNSNTNYTTSVQVLLNSTQLFSQGYSPNSAIDYVTSGFTKILNLTGGTSYTLQTQLATSNNMGTAKIRDASVLIFKIQNYYEATTVTPLTITSDIYQDALTLSIPSPAAGEYLVMASTSVVSSISSKDIFCNWLRGSTSQAEITRQLARNTESRNWLMMRVMTFTTAAETLKLQFKVQSPNTLTVNSQQIIAVKLSDLGIDPKITESESPASTLATTYTNKVTATITPSPQKKGDYLIMGFAMINGDSKKKNTEAYARMLFDGTLQIEKVLQPSSITDYIPFFAFKKYRIYGTSATVSFEYKSGNTDTTTTIKNTRILAIKLNTLQSYQDAGVTPRTTFDATYPVVYIHGYAYDYRFDAVPPVPTPYKIAYYDGGTAHDGIGGNLVYAHSINSNYNRSISSSLAFNNYPGSSYGIWHAVIYRAMTGDPAPPSIYLSNDSNSVMEIPFTVLENAFPHAPPSITEVKLYNTDHVTEATSMTPQNEYAIKVTVSNAYTIADVSSVKVTLFYDADGIYNPLDVPVSANTQTAAILTCTTGTVPVWTISPSSNTTWSIVQANCVQPGLDATTGDFWFHFKPGKVATATYDTARWHVFALAVNPGGTATGYKDNRQMNWYGEIVVNTSTIDFGSVSLGSNFTENMITDISIKYICNGNYTKKIKTDSFWTGSDKNVILNTLGEPGTGEFSLKADDTSVLDNAVLVTAAYSTTGIGVQTGESGNTDTANTIWLKLGELGFPVTTYTGNMYYSISQ